MSDSSIDVDIPRIVTGFADKHFGSVKKPGVPLQSVTLLGGKRGSGKSRFTLQWLSRVALATKRDVMLFQLEEPRGQVIDRGRTLSLPNLDRIRLYDAESLADQNGVDLGGLVAKHKPSAVVLDSLKKATGGDPRRGAEVCALCKVLAGRYKCPFVIVSQVTKDEEYEGFEEVQHEVDILMQFSHEEQIGLTSGKVLRMPPEGGEKWRCLETKDKNRFGECGQLTWFHMRETGLEEFDPDAEPGLIIEEEGD